MELTGAIAWDRGASDAWSRIAETSPKVGVCLAILIVGALLVRIAARLLAVIAGRCGVDRVLERGGLPALLRRPAGEIRTGALRALAGLGHLTVLRVAVGVFGPSAAGSTITELLILLLHTAVAIIVVLLGVSLARLARTFVREALRDLTYRRAVSDTVAAVIVIAFGKAGLDEVGLATSVTTPVLWAILATVGGVVVVGVGGGLVRPMQRRWEEILDHAEQSAAAVRLARHGGQPGPEHPPEPAPTTGPVSDTAHEDARASIPAPGEAARPRPPAARPIAASTATHRPAGPAPPAAQPPAKGPRNL
ncbi:conserved membrane hypothetical protein [Frankia canadensis]|uniref:Uncharacterized protein n=1 Tax=Frankia canadensis TaxID=1836972 RepID=A0A2I2KQU4_9ACTN|nr:hypothetical protein [Frankia canadensis]SNQ48038.1 conserved membrane hypothetical protein [Frankia canadensis]SOU55328.1 conserved membrane hypothetical protein [Frankia canadensis]